MRMDKTVFQLPVEFEMPLISVPICINHQKTGWSRNFQGGVQTLQGEKQQRCLGAPPHTVRCPVSAKIRGVHPSLQKLWGAMGCPPLNPTLENHLLICPQEHTLTLRFSQLWNIHWDCFYHVNIYVCFNTAFMIRPGLPKLWVATLFGVAEYAKWGRGTSQIWKKKYC